MRFVLAINLWEISSVTLPLLPQTFALKNIAS